MSSRDPTGHGRSTAATGASDSLGTPAAWRLDSRASDTDPRSPCGMSAHSSCSTAMHKYSDHAAAYVFGSRGCILRRPQVCWGAEIAKYPEKTARPRERSAWRVRHRRLRLREANRIRCSACAGSCSQRSGDAIGMMIRWCCGPGWTSTTPVSNEGAGGGGQHRDPCGAAVSLRHYARRRVQLKLQS
jgi:hypothetical protein